MAECLRCGKCCITGKDNIWVRCRFLTEDNLCSTYDKRHGVVLAYEWDLVCGDRKDTIYDFPGCPLNSGKPMHPKYKEFYGS